MRGAESTALGIGEPLFLISLVGPQGFEPWTLGLKVRCSARLSYRPTLMGWFDRFVAHAKSVWSILSGLGRRFKVNGYWSAALVPVESLKACSVGKRRIWWGGQ